MPATFHRTDEVDARGYPVYLIGYGGELIRWSPETTPEIHAFLHAMACNRCWLDLSELTVPGASVEKARDAVQKRLSRAVRSIAAVVPELAQSLDFQTACDGVRVVGRMRAEAPRVDTFAPGVVPASASRRSIAGIAVQPGT